MQFKNLLGVHSPSVTNVIALHGRYRSAKEAIVIAGEPSLTYTYARLAQEMDSVADAVSSCGLSGRRVATLLLNDTPRVLSTMLGCVRGGASLVPLNATLRPHQIDGMLRDSDTRLIIACEKYSKLVPDSVHIDRMGFDFENELWKSSSSLYSRNRSSFVEQLKDSDEFNIIYSSGTTGQPKGIVLTQANRLHWAWSNAIAMRYQEDSRSLTTTALYSNGTFLVTLPTLFVGATLHIMKQFDPLQTLEIIQRERISHIFMVPTQLKMCVDAGASRFDLSSLKMVLSAGSTLGLELKKQILKDISPNLFELYGNSEGFATMLFPEEHSVKFASVGRPLLGNDVRIVEAEGDIELPTPDAIGEICVRGPGMMLKYNASDQETSRDIWTDPKSGLKYFRSGDIGKLDSEGYLSLMERKKDMIISGGFNIFPKDIEEIMLQNEDIHDVAVVAGTHSKWGETPVAIVIPKPGRKVIASAIRDWTNHRVSKVQRLFHVHLLESHDSLPRNVLGKIMKKDLRSKLDHWGVPRS